MTDSLPQTKAAVHQLTVNLGISSDEAILLPMFYSRATVFFTLSCPLILRYLNVCTLQQNRIPVFSKVPTSEFVACDYPHNNITLSANVNIISVKLHLTSP
jgi:hypothetical protein